jgi:hypothetical protein
MEARKQISKEDALQDYFKCIEFDLSNLTKDTRTGNKFVNYFTFEERLNTKSFKGQSVKGQSFYDFLNPEHLETISVKKMIDFYKNKGADTTSLKILYKIYKFTTGNCIGLFTPIRAREILYVYQYNIHTILDPCMGWGCRMTATASLNIPRYIGIDLNPNLKVPLTDMSLELNKVSNTNFELYFTDCLKIDYSKLKYDCIFTSPPYFNKELYTGTIKRTNEEWIKDFYQPLFKIIWKHLRQNGMMILSIPNDIFEIVRDVIGKEPYTRFPLLRRYRSKEKEYIFVWVK